MKALQLPKTNSGERPTVGVSSPTATAHQPSKAHEPAWSHEPVKSQDSAKSPAPVKFIEPPKAHQIPKHPEPAAKTRELEIVYIPPVEAKAPAVSQRPFNGQRRSHLRRYRLRQSGPRQLRPSLPRGSAPARKAASPESFSPVVELPRIDYYPTTTPVESLIPVASASRARAANGRRRPMVLGTAVAVLIAGAYVGLSGAMPANEAVADNGPMPAVAPEPVHQLAVAPAAVSDSSIKAPVVTAATPTSGPTFGPPPARPAPAPAPAPKRQVVTSIGATTPAPLRASAKDSVEAIEPAPVDVDVSVPSAPSGDSLAPVVRDSNGIGKILRAVSGKGGSSRP